MAGVPKTDFVWMDGRLVPWDEANVHILTHTLHYGMGVFEGTRAYAQSEGGTAIFRLEEHLERLYGSARTVHLGLPFDLDALRQASFDLMAANTLGECYLRHIAWIGDGVMGLHPGDNPIRMAIVAWAWGAYLGEEGLKNGVRCKVSTYVRPFPNTTMTKAKVVGNYVNSILAKREAVSLGYNEAILLDTGGFVSECSGENLFLVRDGVVMTAQTGVLEGITRRTVMTVARDQGLEVQERQITRDELYLADEVFMSGTAAEITPVREIDDRPVGDGRPGPITEDLQDRFFRLVRGELPEYRHWLTPVDVGALVRDTAAV